MNVPDLVQAHASELATLSLDLPGATPQDFEARLTSFVGKLLGTIPGVGPILQRVLEDAFRNSSHQIMSAELAALSAEQDQQARHDALRDLIEDLLGQAIYQIVKAQGQRTDALHAQLAQHSDQLRAFGDALAAHLGRSAAFDAEVGHVNVNAGGTGIRLRSDSNKRVRVQEINVTGPGAVGLEL
jgi:hypothetical protein